MTARQAGVRDAQHLQQLVAQSGRLLQEYQGALQGPMGLGSAAMGYALPVVDATAADQPVLQVAPDVVNLAIQREVQGWEIDF